MAEQRHNDALCEPAGGGGGDISKPGGGGGGIGPLSSFSIGSSSSLESLSPTMKCPSGYILTGAGFV